jgi:hypothetical protein
LNLFTANRRGARLAPLLALALLLPVASPASLASAQVTDAPQCKDVYFVSVRGSGENAANAGDMSDSSETKAVLTGLKNRLKNTGKDLSVGVYQVPYPALSTDELKKNLSGPVDKKINTLLKKNVPRYLGSEQEGELVLGHFFDEIQQLCASENLPARFVLAGYSQGAMVIHNFLRSVARTADGGASARTIIGAVLIADPSRMPNSPLTNFGTARDGRNGFGDCHAVDLLPGKLSCLEDGGVTTEVPKKFRSRTLALCDEGDVVCDVGAMLKVNTRRGFIQAFKNGLFVHTQCHNYCGKRTRGMGRHFANKLPDLD